MHLTADSSASGGSQHDRHPMLQVCCTAVSIDCQPIVQGCSQAHRAASSNTYGKSNLFVACWFFIAVAYAGSLQQQTCSRFICLIWTASSETGLASEQPSVSKHCLATTHYCTTTEYSGKFVWMRDMNAPVSAQNVTA